MATDEEGARVTSEHDILVELAALRDELSHDRKRIAELESSLDHIRSAVVASAVRGLEEFQKTTVKEMKALAARVEEDRAALDRVNRRADALSEDAASIVVRLEDMKELVASVDTDALQNGLGKTSKLAQSTADELRELARIVSSLERSLAKESRSVKEELARVERELKPLGQLATRVDILETTRDDLDERADEMAGVLEAVRAHLAAGGGARELPIAYERIQKERTRLERRLDDVVEHLRKRSPKQG